MRLTAPRLLLTIALPEYKHLVYFLPFEIIPSVLFTEPDLGVLGCVRCEDLVAWLEVCVGINRAGVAKGEWPVIERSA